MLMDMHEYVMKLHIYGLEALKMMPSKICEVSGSVFLDN